MAILSCSNLTFTVTLLVAFAMLVRNEFRRVPSERIFWIGTALFFAALTGTILEHDEPTWEAVAATASALAAVIALRIMVRNEWRCVPSEKLFWISAGLFFAALAVCGIAT